MNAREAAAKFPGRLVATMLAGSWRASLPAFKFPAEKLDQVTPLLYNSGSAAQGWWRVRETELRDTSAAEVLHQGYRLQALQIAMRQDKIELAHRLLVDANIEAILYKGWAVAGYYSNRLLRPLGDIDLLVRPNDFAAASALFGRPEAIGCWVDLHRGLIEIKDRPTNDLFDRSDTELLGSTRVRVLSAEDHLALLAIHLLKHGAWRPLWLCDIAAIVESVPADFDWKICFGSSKRRAAWIASSIVLAHRLLGANIDQVPLTESQKQVPEWFIDATLTQWGNSFPGDHLPVQPRPLMKQSLYSFREAIKAIGERWPSPIVATFDMRARINNLPRFPYQLGAFSFRLGHFLLDNLGRAKAQS